MFAIFFPEISEKLMTVKVKIYFLYKKKLKKNEMCIIQFFSQKAPKWLTAITRQN